MTSCDEWRSGRPADSSRAAPSVRSTLTTLGELMPKDELNRLASQLPRELQQPLRAGGERVEELKGVGVERFLARVAQREGLSPSEALHHARAVFDVLEQAVTGLGIHHLRELLPEKFAALFVPPAAASSPEAHRHHPHR
jgi:uncharacterized protein (DUF2267 family)